MSHSIFAGKTEFGKTFLAQKICSQYRKKGYETIVLDPMSDPSWDATFRTRKAEEFLKAAKASRSCALFIDEGTISVGQYASEIQWCFTMARHWGHQTHLISQRAVRIDVTARDQCTYLYLFRVSAKDAKIFADDFADEGLVKASGLQKYQFLFSSPTQPAKLCKLKLD